MKPRLLVRIVAYLVMYVGIPAFALLLNHEIISAILAIGYILLVIPFGILRMIDFYRSNDGTTVASHVFNLLFRLPLALFGLVCLFTGIAIIGWVLYNLFIERQEEYTGPLLIFGFSSFGIGVPLVLYGWFTLRSVVRRKEPSMLSPEERGDV